MASAKSGNARKFTSFSVRKTWRAAIFNEAKSLAGIVRSHRPALWVHEQTPYRAELSHLDPDEQTLFDELVQDRLGQKVRLEQERVSYAFLERSLRVIRVSYLSP